MYLGRRERKEGKEGGKGRKEGRKKKEERRVTKGGENKEGTLFKEGCVSI